MDIIGASYAPPRVVRSCQVCQLPLAESSSDWVKFCDDCYHKRRDEWDAKEKRTCAECKEPGIAADAPAWRTVCNKCYYNALT